MVMLISTALAEAGTARPSPARRRFSLDDGPNLPAEATPIGPPAAGPRVSRTRTGLVAMNTDGAAAEPSVADACGARAAETDGEASEVLAVITVAPMPA